MRGNEDEKKKMDNHSHGYNFCHYLSDRMQEEE